MGIFTGLLKGSDEAARAADDIAAGSDDVIIRSSDDSRTFVSNDETVGDFFEESASGVNPNDETFVRSLTRDFTNRVGEGSSPAAVVEAGTSPLATSAKWLGGGAVGVTGLWAGSEFYDDYSALKTAESKEAAYSEYVAAREEIMNNENLSPDQKEEALARLNEAYNQAVENPDNGGANGILTDTMEDLFAGMGFFDKVFVGVTFVAIVIVISRRMDNNGGMD